MNNLILRHNIKFNNKHDFKFVFRFKIRNVRTEDVEEKKFNLTLIQKNAEKFKKKIKIIKENFKKKVRNAEKRI